ncbi:MAG: transcriptional regulator, partial [Prevotella sp.]|nr:transcriptional regulator [Prevotella sp.]
MRKNILSLLFLFFICINAFPHSRNLDSIYSCLDYEIVHANKYVVKKKAIINILKKQLDRASENTLKYAVCYQLYEEYRPFENKMAMYYLERCRNIAEASNSRNNVNECLARLSLCCSNTGLYDEAEKFLLQVNVDELTKSGLAVYYHAQYILNNQLAYYTSVESMKPIYNEKTQEYQDKLLACLPVHDNLRYQVLELKLIS